LTPTRICRAKRSHPRLENDREAVVLFNFFTSVFVDVISVFKNSYIIKNCKTKHYVFHLEADEKIVLLKLINAEIKSAINNKNQNE